MIFFILGSASCCVYFFRVIRRTVPRNSSSSVYSILYCLCVYMACGSILQQIQYSIKYKLQYDMVWYPHPVLPMWVIPCLSTAMYRCHFGNLYLFCKNLHWLLPNSLELFTNLKTEIQAVTIITATFFFFYVKWHKKCLLWYESEM
jgi:hypothetical protein